MRTPGLIPLAASLACLSGCVCLPAAHTEQVAFSRDGKTVAWTGEEGTVVTILFGYVTQENGYVRWIGSDRPGAEHSLRLYSGWGGPPCGYSSPPGILGFSPNGRLLALLGSTTLQVVDLDRGQLVPLSLPVWQFISAAWMDDTTLAFAAWDNGHDRTATVIGALGMADARITEILRTPGTAWVGPNHWSADGRHVVLSRDPRSEVAELTRLIEIPSGRVIATFGDASMRLPEVAWRRDGRAVACLLKTYACERGHFGPQTQADLYYYSPGSGTYRHHTWKRPPDAAHWGISGLEWTGQDRWLIVSRRQPDEHSRDLLWDPQTGEFRDILDGAARLLGTRADLRLLPLQAPGYLVAVTDGKKAWAVDDALRRSVLLASHAKWALSPDGRLVAEADAWNRVRLRPSGLGSGK